MKYALRGGIRRKLQTKILSVSTSFIMVSSGLTGVLPLLLTQPAFADTGPATVTPAEFTTINDTAHYYKGVDVGFSLSGDFGTLTGINVSLYDGANLICTNTAAQDMLNYYNGGGRSFTTPFVIQKGAYDPATETYWNLGPCDWNQNDAPTQVVISATGTNGTASNHNDALALGGGSFASLFPSAPPSVTAGDFATWNNAPTFKGIDVGFTLNNFTHVSDIKVTLKTGNGTPISTNTATPAFVNMVNSQHLTSLSSPFVVSGSLSDTYCGGGPCWTSDNHIWVANDSPYEADVTVTQNGTDYPVTISPLTENGTSFASLIPSVAAGDFDTWDASAQGFKGINVGFTTSNFLHVDGIKVTLQKNGADIVSNTASQAFLDKINSQGLTSLSSPFVVSGTLTDTYCNGGPCWLAGTHTWLHSEKPDKAVITVTQNGVDYPATDTNLSEATATFDSLIAPDTVPPTITDATITNDALWGPGYNILALPHHRSDSTGLPVIGGTVQVSADFNDDRLLTNFTAYLPGINFFPGSEADWSGIPTGIHTVTWNTNGSDWQHVRDGNYTFTFQAKDGGNGQNQTQNVTEKQIPVTVDNTGPSVSFVPPTPAENHIVHGTITVAGNFTDANGLMNTDIGVNTDGRSGEGWKCHTDWPTQGTKTCQIDTAQLADGTYKLTMAGRDKAGNVTQVFRTITVDNTAPVVNITAPGNGASVHGTVTISGTVTDNNPDHYYLVVKDAKGKQVAGPGTVYAANVADYKWNTTKVSDGIYTIDLEARDAAGNKDSNSTATIQVTVDNTAPVVTGNFAVNMQTGDKVTLSPTVTGETGPVTYAWDVSDSKLLNNPNDTLDGSSLKIGPAPKGSYTVTLTVTDAAGNATQKTYNVTITTPSAAPQITDNTTDGSVRNASFVAAPQNNGNNSNDNSSPNGGNGGTTGQVLGSSTDTPSNTGDDSGHVKGSSVTLSNNRSDTVKNRNFLLLGWWWLIFLGALAAFFAISYGRRQVKD